MHQLGVEGIGAPIGRDPILVGGADLLSKKAFGLHSCLLGGERDLAPHAELFVVASLGRTTNHLRYLMSRGHFQLLVQFCLLD